MASHFAVAMFVLAIVATGAIAQTSHPTPTAPAGHAMKAQGKTAPKPAAIIDGRIKSFECGDNCYLTITFARGRAETGLCEAKACAPWFENQAMPPSFVGRRVRVTTAIGVQRDDAGNVMGKMTSFKTLEFVK